MFEDAFRQRRSEYSGSELRVMEMAENLRAGNATP
ncbi:hypothetical protein SFR_3113 [Streptomyces sp. FR-008]|nr:hypothetical protein SFR_3113 [Streptomyces sp. FR-008]